MDFERASMLLNIVEKAVGHPKLSPLMNAAAAELEALNDAAIKEGEKRVEEARTRQARFDAAAAKNATGVQTVKFEDPKPVDEDPDLRRRT